MSNITISELGSLGEFVGAIAVVISLIYVGLQIRQSNQLSRANTFQNVNFQFIDIWSMVASNDDLARIHQRAKVGERLEPDDFEKYTAFLLSYFAWLEDVYVQQQSGLFAIKLGHGDVVDFMEPQFSTFLNSPQLKEWVLGPWTGFSPDFVARLTEILGPQTQADNAGTGTGA